jgi:hypothetical protein
MQSGLEGRAKSAGVAAAVVVPVHHATRRSVRHLAIAFGESRFTQQLSVGEVAMTAKERFILAASMSSVMVAMVTLIGVLLNLGLHRGFVEQWAKAYFIAWPVAALTGFAVMPMARRFTARIVTWIGSGA